MKTSLRLAKLIFFLILYIHCIGCLWFFMVSFDETWVPPEDYVWVGTTIYRESKFFQYWSAQYHSVLLLTGNDVGPRGWW